MQRRWPEWVYGAGEDPDYRFSFANERTFLAWVRTALALLACGVALDAVDLGASPGLQRALAVVLVVLGLAVAVLAWTRWARSERAMRRREPLPGPALTAVLSAGLLVVGVAVLVVLR
jgi:putative membrane protein